MLSFSSPKSGYRIRKEAVRPGDALFFILIILTPLISAAILRILTGTSALNLDAWNTTWND